MRRYTRFKKSKDVSSYSEKDLSEIFGRKADDSASKPKATPAVPESPSSAHSGTQELSSFITTTSKSNMRDYFAKRLQEKGVDCKGGREVLNGWVALVCLRRWCRYTISSRGRCVFVLTDELFGRTDRRCASLYALHLCPHGLAGVACSLALAWTSLILSSGVCYRCRPWLYRAATRELLQCFHERSHIWKTRTGIWRCRLELCGC